jgi:hypothetical protein
MQLVCLITLVISTIFETNLREDSEGNEGNSVGKRGVCQQSATPERKCIRETTRLLRRLPNYSFFGYQLDKHNNANYSNPAQFIHTTSATVFPRVFRDFLVVSSGSSGNEAGSSSGATAGHINTAQQGNQTQQALLLISFSQPRCFHFVVNVTQVETGRETICLVFF